MPKDNERGGASKALYITFFFTGLGYLFPFNVLVSDIDFLKESYPSLNLEFIISIAYNIPCVFVLLLLVKFGDRLSFSGRIYTAFGVDLAVLAALAGLRFISISPPLLLWSTVAASIVTGCAAAVVDGTLFGLASKFPSSCVQAVMAAIPLSGTVTGLQKIIIKLVIVSINGGEGEVSEATVETETQLNSRIYFIVSCAMVIVSIVAYSLLRRQREAKAVLNRCNVKAPIQYSVNRRENQALLNDENDPADSKDSRTSESETPHGSLVPGRESFSTASAAHVRAKRRRWAVFKKIWVHGFTVFLSYTIALAVYPGLVSSMKPNDPSFEGWYPIILLTLVQVSDMAGRYLPLLKIPRKVTSFNWISAIVRVAFIPLMILCVKPRIFGEAVAIVLVIVSSMSLGFVSTLSMGAAPSLVDEAEEEIAGTLMSFCLNAGLVVGSLIGLGIEAYLIGHV